jgi:hypothetical protein
MFVVSAGLRQFNLMLEDSYLKEKELSLMRNLIGHVKRNYLCLYRETNETYKYTKWAKCQVSEGLSRHYIQLPLPFKDLTTFLAAPNAHSP